MREIEISGPEDTPKVHTIVDLGDPILNLTVDGFLKIGAVSASRVIADEAFDCMLKRSISKKKVQDALKRMCTDGVYWGTAAGVYVGMEYGIGSIRDTRDWKNGMLAGAITGALVSAARQNHRDQVVRDAITGCAMGTAVELLKTSWNIM